MSCDFFLLFTITYVPFFSIFCTHDNSFLRKILFLIHKETCLAAFYIFFSISLFCTSMIWRSIYPLPGVLSLFPYSPEKIHWWTESQYMKMNKRIFIHFHYDILSVIVPWSLSFCNGKVTCSCAAGQRVIGEPIASGLALDESWLGILTLTLQQIKCQLVPK